MLDLRPVVNLLGIMVAVLGMTMLVPAVAAFAFEDGEFDTFLLTSFICMAVGGGLGLVTAGSARGKLNIQQVFLITTLVWLVLPIFGALPFVIGAPNTTYTNAFFEAMSGDVAMVRGGRDRGCGHGFAACSEGWGNADLQVGGF